MRSDELRIKVGSLGGELAKEYELSSYYPGYVRQLDGLASGRRYFVIPVFGRAEPLPPARCQPATLRRELVEQRRLLLTEVFYCVIETSEGRLRGRGCEPFAAVDEDRPVFKSGVARISGEPVVGLVPDGVASVRITYGETAPIVVPASNNAFLFFPPHLSVRLQAKLHRLGREEERDRLSRTQQLSWTLRWNRAVKETEPTRVEWLDGAGGIIRTISPPTSATSLGIARTPVKG